MELNKNEQPIRGFDPAFLEKMLSIILVISIVLLVCTAIPQINGPQFFKVLGWIQYILNIAGTLTIAILLILMGSQHKGYRIAGILMLVGDVVFRLAAWLLPLGMISLYTRYSAAISLLISFAALLFSVGALTVRIISSYKLYNAHSDIVSATDPVLSQKWKKYFVLDLTVAIGYTFLNFAISFVLSLMEIDTVVVTRILEFLAQVPLAALECVYLYRMIQNLKNVYGGHSNPHAKPLPPQN